MKLASGISVVIRAAPTTSDARWRSTDRGRWRRRLRTLPGEQAQVDWAHFGRHVVGSAERQLMAFVMVLSFSRMVFLRFYLSAAMPSFLHGHVSAFGFFGGVLQHFLRALGGAAVAGYGVAAIAILLGLIDDFVAAAWREGAIGFAVVVAPPFLPSSQASPNRLSTWTSPHEAGS